MSAEPLKLNHPYTDDEARTNLLRFITAKDRAAPPIFVGREEMIERIAFDVANRRQSTDKSECFTIAVNGAPGAGKTSLLGELEKRLNGEIANQERIDDSLVVVVLSGEMLRSETIVANKIIEYYSGGHLDVRKERTTTLTGKGELIGIGASRQRTTKQRSLQQQIENAGLLWQSVIDNTSVNKEDTVFLLLVDEAQNIPGNSSSVKHGERDKNNIVMELHGGSQSTQGLKIVPVFAGLSDTVSVLAARGVSRLPSKSSIKIGALTQDETEELVSRWLRHAPFGFENLFTDSDIDWVSKKIAVTSEGWPRHANAYLRELAVSVLEQSASSGLTLNFDEVLERGHDERLEYYGDRLTAATLGDYALVIQDAAQSSTDGVVGLKTLHDIAQINYGMSPIDSQLRHEKAIHAGILEQISRNDRTRFKFPIPSLFTYMQCREDPVKFKAKMRAHMDENAHLWSGS